jgi:hypothetical protein
MFLIKVLIHFLFGVLATPFQGFALVGETAFGSLALVEGLLLVCLAQFL